MADDHTLLRCQSCRHLLPQMTPNSPYLLDNNPATNTILTRQVVGGTGFIISSWLFMLETQPNWHTPSLTTLGWHIGFWNLIGALGFTLCGALGFASGSSPACETASLWSTFIGSWAFLVCSRSPYPHSLSYSSLSSSRKMHPHVGMSALLACTRPLSPSGRSGAPASPVHGARERAEPGPSAGDSPHEAGPETNKTPSPELEMLRRVCRNLTDERVHLVSGWVHHTMVRVP